MSERHLVQATDIRSFTLRQIALIKRFSSTITTHTTPHHSSNHLSSIIIATICYKLHDEFQFSSCCSHVEHCHNLKNIFSRNMLFCIVLISWFILKYSHKYSSIFRCFSSTLFFHRSLSLLSSIHSSRCRVKTKL